MSDLAVFFSEFVLSPSWIQVSFILIDGWSLFSTRRVLWCINNLLGVAFNAFQENPMNL